MMNGPVQGDGRNGNDHPSPIKTASNVESPGRATNDRGPVVAIVLAVASICFWWLPFPIGHLLLDRTGDIVGLVLVLLSVPLALAATVVGAISYARWQSRNRLRLLALLLGAMSLVYGVTVFTSLFLHHPLLYP